MTNKIIFLGNGHGAIVGLKSLQDKFDKIGILTNDNDVTKLFRPTDYEIKSLSNTSNSTIVMAGWQKVLPRNIIKLNTVINTHPSLLPKYRGMHSLVWAMLNEEKEFGFTIHIANEFIDDGDILSQFKVPNLKQTSTEIMQQFDDYVLKNLGKVVKDYLNKKISPLPQDKTKATWVCKRNLEDCIINFNWDHNYISTFFRALVRPYPLPIIKVGNKLYEISKHSLQKAPYHAQNGRIINIEKDKVYIKYHDGILITDELICLETNKKLLASSILKIGQRIQSTLIN